MLFTALHEKNVSPYFFSVSFYTHAPIQFFYAKMGKDGRIYIPELALAFFQEEKQSLAGSVFEVTLKPT